MIIEVLDERFGHSRTNWQKIINHVTIALELSMQGKNSPFFKRVLEIIKSSEESKKEVIIYLVYIMLIAVLGNLFGVGVVLWLERGQSKTVKEQDFFHVLKGRPLSW